MRQKPTKTITSNYTTTDADCGFRIICNSSSAITITLHTATYRINFELEIDNIGAGDVTCGGQIIRQYSHAHVGNNNGAAWVVVIGGGSLILGETASTAYRGDMGKTAYDNALAAYAHAQSAHARVQSIPLITGLCSTTFDHLTTDTGDKLLAEVLI